MDGFNEWIIEWINKWKDGWVDGQTDKMISSSWQHDVLTLQKHTCNWLSHNQLVSEWMDLTGWKVEWTNKWNKEGVDGWMDG